MLDMLLFLVLWYLKIGIGVYLIYNIVIIIKSNIMPWDFLFTMIHVIFSPAKFLAVLMVTILMIVTWPMIFFIIGDLLHPKETE